ncbi:hypothetical protein E0L35_07150 [Halomonas sp. ATBC28]|nr:hypothetical protein CXF94_01955 [Halomonas sp. Choline-3u-9]QGQ69748.1 hypothetical protein FDY98_06085 [Halomonas sp. PA16-9]TMU25648.1 hypothetical protein E0L35_07150 [Halomonas sp. ATBC28]
MEPLINVMSEGQTRQKSTKKRSLRVVNEHFEAIFNAVWSSAIVNQRFLIIWSLYVSFMCS